MAIKYYLTVSNGNYTIETTEGCGFSGSCANLACAFDDSQESVRITDKAWRNWMPILDATADEIETDGEDLSYSELIAYLQTIMTSGGGGGGDSGLQLGETSTTAYRGDRGKTAYNHAQLTTGNPHNVSKSDVGLGNVDNTSDLNKPVSSAMQTALSGKANSTHSHAQSDVNGLATALSGKQDTLTAGSNITIVNNVISATGGGGGGGANWGEIGGTLSNQTDLATALNGKASSSHSHSISDVTNLQSSLDGKASSTHSHTISEITNLQTTLNGKQSTLTFDDAPTSGSSNPVKSSGIKSALDGKANSTHSHAISDVTDLQTALDGKQATLTAGTNITIVGNVISAAGGGGTSVPCYYVNCHQSGGSWVFDNPSELTSIYTALSAFISAPAGYANASSMFFVLQPSDTTTQVDWIVFNEIMRESASSPVFHVTFVTRQQGRRGTFDLTVNATQQTASLSFEPEAETLTEAQYAALTKDATKVYYVTANS